MSSALRQPFKHSACINEISSAERHSENVLEAFPNCICPVSQSLMRLLLLCQALTLHHMKEKEQLANFKGKNELSRAQLSAPCNLQQVSDSSSFKALTKIEDGPRLQTCQWGLKSPIFQLVALASREVTCTTSNLFI
ncbi:hypothetical protein QQP08_009254 [Theobroma cacao]|nr:hypothetical protein QQP08_009254 [Theobroma cacao]